MREKTMREQFSERQNQRENNLVREQFNDRRIEWENERMREIWDIGGTEGDFQWLGEPLGGFRSNRWGLLCSPGIRSTVRTLQVNLVREKDAKSSNPWTLQNLSISFGNMKILKISRSNQKSATPKMHTITDVFEEKSMLTLQDQNQQLQECLITDVFERFWW